jgi:hypothetical protein
MRWDSFFSHDFACGRRSTPPGDTASRLQHIADKEHFECDQCHLSPDHMSESLFCMNPRMKTRADDGVCCTRDTIAHESRAPSVTMPKEDHQPSISFGASIRCRAVRSPATYATHAIGRRGHTCCSESSIRRRLSATD